jgi:hypothetical protein
VNGNSRVTGTLGVTGATRMSSLSTTGNTSVGGSLDVTEEATMTGLLTANGGISTNTVSATNNITANSFSTTNGNVSINNGNVNLTSNGSGGLYFLRNGTTIESPEYNSLYTGETTATILTASKNPDRSYKFIPDGSSLSLSAYDGNNTVTKRIANFNDNRSTNFLEPVIINGRLQVKGKTWNSPVPLNFEAVSYGTDNKYFIPDTEGYKLFVITLIGKNWNRGGNRNSSYGYLSIKYDDKTLVGIGAKDGDPPMREYSYVFYMHDPTKSFTIGLNHTSGDPILCIGEWKLTGIM